MHFHILQHVPFEGPGSILSWLETRRADVTYTRFHEAPALPSGAEFDALVIMGGPMSVNDETALLWLVDEKRFVAEAVRAGKPVLGICLGAQLIASALGARVYPAPQKEIGWFPVNRVGQAPGGFLFPERVTVFHWHGETFDLPQGAVRLAGSEACANQAFQLGPRTIGLQFHLETTPASADAIISGCRDELVPSKFVQSESELRQAPASAYWVINDLMGRLLDYLTRPGWGGPLRATTRRGPRMQLNH
jgi:GMP synthase-like glutamine amidotransferase